MRFADLSGLFELICLLLACGTSGHPHLLGIRPVNTYCLSLFYHVIAFLLSIIITYTFVTY